MNFKKERRQDLRNGGSFSHSAEPTESGVVVTGDVLCRRVQQRPAKAKGLKEAARGLPCSAS